MQQDSDMDTHRTAIARNNNHPLLVPGRGTFTGSNGGSSGAGITPPQLICLCQAPARIPRPRNAFILFRQHHHASVMAQNPGKPNPEISKIIGHMWKNSEDNVKALWQGHADEEKRQHIQRYPQYRYQPRRSSKKAPTGGNSPSLLETTICSSCGGRTGALQAFQRQLPNPPVRRQSRRSHSPPWDAPPSDESRGTSIHTAVTGFNGLDAGVEALLRLGLHAEDDAILDGGNSSNPLKRRRLDPPHSPTSRSLSDPSILSQSVYPNTFSAPSPSSNNHQTQYHEDQYPHHHHTASSTSSASPYLQGPPHPPPITDHAVPVLRRIQAIRRICPPLPSLTNAFSNVGTSRAPIVSLEGSNPQQVFDLHHLLRRELLHYPSFPHIYSHGEPDDLIPIPLSTSSSSNTTQPTAPLNSPISSHVQQQSTFFDPFFDLHPHQSRPPVTHRHQPQSQPIQSSSPLPPKPVTSYPPVSDSDAEAARYMNHVASWRLHSTLLRRLVSPPSHSSQLPPSLVLLNRYILSRSDAAARRLPTDGLSPVEHWQWCASLWRSCVGPDLVVYVQEVEEGQGEVVDVVREFEGGKVLFVRKVEGKREWKEEVVRRVVAELEELVRVFRGGEVVERGNEFEG